MGWYRYTSHSENNCTDCDMGWYRYMSHSENHCTECDMGDTDIRPIVKTTAQSVIWSDTNIGLRLIEKTTVQSVIWDDTPIYASYSENDCTKSGQVRMGTPVGWRGYGSMLQDVGLCWVLESWSVSPISHIDWEMNHGNIPHTLSLMTAMSLLQHWIFVLMYCTFSFFVI